MDESDPSTTAEGGSETTARARRRPARSLLSTFTSPDSYGLLLLLIAVTYGVAVSVHGSQAFSIVLVFAMLTLWLALNTSDAHRAVKILALVLIVVAGLAVIGSLVRQQSDVGHRFVDLAALFLYFLAPWVIVRHLATREIDVQTILGAISAYLLIGMFYAFFYQFLGRVQGGAFFGSGGDGDSASYLFFSFTTLTTTGYGNLVPAGNPGQSLAVTEMILGQLFLIATVGKVLAEWRPRRRPAATGDEPSQ
jgi:Ion channel